MGRVYTPKYALHMDGCTPMEWRIGSRFGMQGYGKPTAENLEKHVMVYAKSLELGGVNEHISKGLGYIPYPKWAYIVENKPGGKVFAKWKAGKFQVYG